MFNVAANIAVISVWCTSSMLVVIYQNEDLMVCESECENVCPFQTMLDFKGHETEDVAASSRWETKGQPMKHDCPCLPRARPNRNSYHRSNTFREV